jgi:23S rRNA (cytidine1920-2'-O)/16S rRNA (cytidine1409-2'-O)-methyltransferase
MKKADASGDYVGRGGDKLAFALDHFSIHPDGRICCDLGSHIGGFVDCWLKHGAAKVYSVDTSYGTLAWTLRNDPRVLVMERTNALHAEIPEAVDFVSCDVGWTPQRKVLPVAMRMLRPGGAVLSLVKPQYEADKRTELIRGKGRVHEDAIAPILSRLKDFLDQAGCEWEGPVKTPFRGDKGGNPEFFVLVKPLT